MARLKLEQETTITFNEAEDHVLVYSASPRFQRKMAQQGIEPYKQDYGANHSEDEKSCRYRVPKEWIRVSPPRTVRLSPESLKNLTRRVQQPSTESRESEGISIQA
jgi:hypothetical protein